MAPWRAPPDFLALPGKWHECCIAQWVYLGNVFSAPAVKSSCEVIRPSNSASGWKLRKCAFAAGVWT